MLFTYTAPVLTGRLLGTESNSSPVTRIFLRWPSPNSLHSQLEGHPENKFLYQSPVTITCLRLPLKTSETQRQIGDVAKSFIFQVKKKKQGRHTDS